MHQTISKMLLSRFNAKHPELSIFLLTTSSAFALPVQDGCGCIPQSWEQDDAGGVDESTFRKWSWIFVGSDAVLHEDLVRD